MSSNLSKVLNSMEECSACKRISECESLPNVEGYFCEVCLDELALASHGCAFSLMSGGPPEGNESDGRRARSSFCCANHALARHTAGESGTGSVNYQD